MDFLGLRNLDVISDTLEIIKATRGVDLDVDAIPLDDAETLALLCRGRLDRCVPARGRADAVADALAGPEQLRGRGRPRRAVPAGARWPPTCTNDYADRKERFGSRSSTFHPDAEELLADTYGLMIYQESVMRVAQKFAGYSLAEADNLRKGLRQEDPRADEEGAGRLRRRGWSTPATSGCSATSLFDIIEQFADYAFNKSHSFGYGFIAYQTAYLKAHHPAEYLSALLTSVKAKPRQGRHLPGRVPHDGHRGHRARRQPARCRTSRRWWRSGEDGPRGAPDRVRAGRGPQTSAAGLVGLLLAEREANGPFADFYDFCERVDFQVLNKKDAGVADQGGRPSTAWATPRQGLLRAFERIVDGTISRRREAGHGRDVALRRGGRRRRDVRRAPAHPGRRVRQARAPLVREGDARAVRQRPPG